MGQPDFSKLIGSTVSGYQQNEYGKTTPGGKTLIGLDKLGVNVSWLLSGKGEMLLQDSNEITIDVHESKNLPDYTLVPLYNVEASAGHGSLVEYEEKISQIAFRSDWITEKKLNKNQLATIKARGDSMLPTISDGDILLIDTRINKITDDSIYIIKNDGHLVVKRIQQNFDGSINIISDNKIYEKETIPKDNTDKIIIVGKVIWNGHDI